MIPILTRLSGWTFAMLALALAALPASAAGSPYPYCYIDYDGLRSCSFRTLQDCYRIRVGTGMCVTNPYYGVKSR
ncbi:MAG: DUF3551 domain-containing protein [Pseudorhodoplanes sp.]